MSKIREIDKKVKHPKSASSHFALQFQKILTENFPNEIAFATKTVGEAKGEHTICISICVGKVAGLNYHMINNDFIRCFVDLCLLASELVVLTKLTKDF